MIKGQHVATVDSCTVLLRGKRLYTLRDVYYKDGDPVYHPVIGEEYYFDEGDEYHSITLSEFNKIVSGLAYVKGISIAFGS